MSSRVRSVPGVPVIRARVDLRTGARALRCCHGRGGRVTVPAGTTAPDDRAPASAWWSGIAPALKVARETRRLRT